MGGRMLTGIKPSGKKREETASGRQHGRSMEAQPAYRSSEARSALSGIWHCAKQLGLCVLIDQLVPGAAA